MQVVKSKIRALMFKYPHERLDRPKNHSGSSLNAANHPQKVIPRSSGSNELSKSGHDGRWGTKSGSGSVDCLPSGVVQLTGLEDSLRLGGMNSPDRIF